MTRTAFRPEYDAKLPLQGYSISFVGRLSKRPGALKEQIENLGGSTTRTIDRSLDVIISTQGNFGLVDWQCFSSFPDQLNNGHKKLQQAQSFDIHVVPEEFLDQVLNDRPSVVMEKLKLSTWGILPHVRKSRNPTKKRRSSSTSKSTGELSDEDPDLLIDCHSSFRSIEKIRSGENDDEVKRWQRR